MTRFAGIVLAVFLVGSATAVAHAEPLEATFSLTINAMSGQHQVNGGAVDRLSFAPLPLGEITLRRQAESVRIEGLPPVTFGYGGSGAGSQSTRLSIVNATYRHTFGHGVFAGVGQTLYNQSTTYAATQSGYYYTRGFTVDPIQGSEEQYSRVTGLRFEVGTTIDLKNDRIELLAAANPKMHGIQYTRIPTPFTECSFPNGGNPFSGSAVCRQFVETFADPEKAAQVDLSARVAHRLSKHGELLYGLRYLNYSAHYDDFLGQLADRNVGFAPTLGYRFRL
jgi:hypothetical protein